MAETTLSIAYRGQHLAGSAHFPDADASGDAVLLLHGFTGSRIEWAYLFVDLGRRLAAQGITVFRFDFAGCGESTGHFADLSIADQVEQTHVLLDELAARYPNLRWHVFGYSMGGLVAAGVVAQRRDLASAVLLAPAGTFGSHLAQIMATSPALPNGNADFISLEISTRLVAEAKAFDLNGTLAQAQLPLLVLHGGKDAVIVPQVGEAAAMAGRGRFVLLPEADHGLCLAAHRVQVAEQVGEWILAGSRVGLPRQ